MENESFRFKKGILKKWVLSRITETKQLNTSQQQHIQGQHFCCDEHILNKFILHMSNCASMMPQINSAKPRLLCNKKLKIKTTKQCTATFFSHSVTKHVLKNMQSSGTFLISLSLLRQDSKDAAYKEYCLNLHCKYPKSLVTALTQWLLHYRKVSSIVKATVKWAVKQMLWNREFYCHKTEALATVNNSL